MADAHADKSERAATNAAGGVWFGDQAFGFWPVDADPCAATLVIQVRPPHMLEICHSTAHCDRSLLFTISSPPMPQA